jgi:hypothetical protein
MLDLIWIFSTKNISKIVSVKKYKNISKMYLCKIVRVKKCKNISKIVTLLYLLVKIIGLSYNRPFLSS